jgi:RhoGAP domain
MIRALTTSPYKPLPQVFHPYYHHDISTLAGAGSEGFGMNLLIWERARALAIEEGDSNDGVKLPEPPKALMLLLEALKQAYADEKRWPLPPAPAPLAKEQEKKEADKADGEEKTPTAETFDGKQDGAVPPSSSSASPLRNAEKRRAWIYEVPLRSIHTLRFALIAALRAQRPEQEILSHLLARADPPVLAALVKTWAMELEETLVPQSCWDTVWSIYRAAAAQEDEALKKLAGEKKSDEKAEEKPAPQAPTLSTEDQQKIEQGILDDLKVVLTKLPKIHLSCLDALIKHLAELQKTTQDSDADPLWLQKIGMSTGRGELIFRDV